MESADAISEQPQPPSPELQEAVKILRQSLDSFLQQAGVDRNEGMKPSIQLVPVNNSGQKHLTLEQNNPLLRFTQKIFGKPVLVRSIEIRDNLNIHVVCVSPNSSPLEEQQKVIVTGESKIARGTTLIINPQEGTFLHADISVPALMINTKIPAGHARFLSDLRSDPVPADAISAVAGLITAGKDQTNYFSRNIILQER